MEGLGRGKRAISLLSKDAFDLLRKTNKGVDAVVRKKHSLHVKYDTLGCKQNAQWEGHRKPKLSQTVKIAFVCPARGFFSLR
jgi:hypothetical protein